jgi:hypothetical protein
VRRAWRALGAYLASDDPLVAASNTIAFLLACNLPLYPLTLWLVTGEYATATFLTALNAPVFLAVPAVSRRHPLAGRVLLIVTGTINSFVSTKVTGQMSGVELFLIPCVVVAVLVFRKGEYAWAWGLIAAIVAAFAALHDRLGEPVQTWAPDIYAGLQRANAVSVVLLTGFIAIALVRARLADKRRPAGIASRPS